MADVSEQPAALAPDDTARVTEFARACKAAARAVVLYPPGHPAIGATVGRIVHVTSAAKLSAPVTLTVLPDGLLMDGRAPARPDPAIGELAALLHAHLIGQEGTQTPGSNSCCSSRGRPNRSAPRAASRASGRRWPASI
jgi:hypothetical protein